MIDRIQGLGCLKLHQISISDRIEEPAIVLQNQIVELIQCDSELSIRVMIDIKELSLCETWEVGISHKFNSSEKLEPYSFAIIRVSSNEFIIRLSASLDDSISDEFVFSIEFYSKFKLELPQQFKDLEMFYDLD
jgi:hypothetical protein